MWYRSCDLHVIQVDTEPYEDDDALKKEDDKRQEKLEKSVQDVSETVSNAFQYKM